MKPTLRAALARREFLKFITASPYVIACGGAAAYWPHGAFAQSASSAPADTLIGTAAEAIDVFDLEPVAQHKVQAGHWAYMVSGVDADATVRANRAGFEHVQLRPRRLRDATRIDTHVDLFGTLCNCSDLYLPHGGRAIVSCRWGIGRSSSGEGARCGADPIDFDIDARRSGERCARPSCMVSTLCASLVGDLREDRAARRGGRLLGAGAHGR
jgi:hypothetical protein